MSGPSSYTYRNYHSPPNPASLASVKVLSVYNPSYDGFKYVLKTVSSFPFIESFPELLQELKGNS